MSAYDVAKALPGSVRNGNGWLVRCPVPSHGKGRGDRAPSLSVHDGRDGRLLVRCFAGCDPLQVLDELRGRGFVDGAEDRDRAPARRTSPLRQREPVEPNPDALAV